jgi:hypothetical protein
LAGYQASILACPSLSRHEGLCLGNVLAGRLVKHRLRRIWTGAVSNARQLVVDVRLIAKPILPEDSVGEALLLLNGAIGLVVLARCLVGCDGGLDAGLLGSNAEEGGYEAHEYTYP